MRLNGKPALLKPRIAVIEGKVTTTSLVVAEHFGKNHFDVLRAIRELTSETPAEFAASNFAVSSYLDPTGRSLPMYRVTRDGFSLLAMGFTGKKALQWKIAYINAFNAMEQSLAGHAPAAADREVSAIDAMTPRQFLQLYYGLDRQHLSAAILWQLIQMGAHRDWVQVSIRDLIHAVGGGISPSGVHKAAQRLREDGLIVIDVRASTRYLVIVKALRQRVESVLHSPERFPGLPYTGAGLLPAGRKLH